MMNFSVRPEAIESQRLEAFDDIFSIASEQMDLAKMPEAFSPSGSYRFKP